VVLPRRVRATALFVTHRRDVPAHTTRVRDVVHQRPPVLLHHRCRASVSAVMATTLVVYAKGRRTQFTIRRAER
jgi:hypothetical protein